jgi:hypothetical protein
MSNSLAPNFNAGLAFRQSNHFSGKQMETKIDPRDPHFDRSTLTGTEVLYCAECGSVFTLDYADALVNKNAERPPNACCAAMMDIYVEAALRRTANEMIDSGNASEKDAGKTLKNALPDTRG